MIRAFLILFFYSTYALAGLQCRSLFERLAVPMEVSHIADLGKELTNTPVSHFFTEQFITEVEREVAPLVKTVKFYNSENGWSNFSATLKGDVSFARAKDLGYKQLITVYIDAGPTNVMKYFILFGQDRSIVTIENLGVSNPLNKNSNLHLSQNSSKGLPIRDFMKSVKYMKSVLKNNHVQQLVADSQNLLVAFLYKKMVRMQPTEISEKYFKYFDEILSERLLGIDELNQALGDYHDQGDVAVIAKAFKLKQTDVKDIHKLKEAMPLYSGDKLVAYRVEVEGVARFVIVDPLSDGKKILRWKSLAEKEQLKLVLNLQD